MSNFDLTKYLAEGKLLKEGEYTYTNDTNTEFGPDVLDLDYDKIRAYISTKKGDDFADNFIDGYNDNFYENVVRFFDKIENPTDEEVLNFIDIEIEKYLAEGKLIKEDITKLRGQELLDFFSFTKYMNVDLEELETEFEDAMNYGQFTDPANVEQDKKDFTYENGDRFLDTNEDKMSEYLGFEIDTEQMIDDYFLGEPKAVEFVHSDEDFEGWMDEIGSFWS